MINSISFASSESIRTLSYHMMQWKLILKTLYETLHIYDDSFAKKYFGYKICYIGLEYLHTGCKPPMVHRDIKSTNILLDERFQAKLADFGLSRSFPIGNETHISTVVAGTPGYLDPE